MDWVENAVRGVVVEAVHKMRGLFAVFRGDIDKKDLVQEGMQRALIMHQTYDDSRHKGQTVAPGRLPRPYSTWITLGVNRCLLDIWRKRPARRSAMPSPRRSRWSVHARRRPKTPACPGPTNRVDGSDEAVNAGGADVPGGEAGHAGDSGSKNGPFAALVGDGRRIAATSCAEPVRRPREIED